MSEPTGKTVQVSWVQLENGHALRYRASDERITTSGDVDGNLIHSVPLPVKAQTRLDLARLVAPEGWSIAPSEQITNTASMLEDLGAILDALSLGNHARPHSPRKVVQREVLPAIERLRAENDNLIAEGIDKAQAAQPDRPEPVDPASVRVGDVVEIEANDGSWMVRARIADTDDREHDGPRYPNDSPFGIKLDRFYLWPKVTGATVRVLHAAEPEPDPAAVEALAEAVRQSREALGPVIVTNEEIARELIKRGVYVEVPSDG